MRASLDRRLLCRLLLGAAMAATEPAGLAAQLNGAIPPMRVTTGTLSFDGHATPGDFTGTTTTVTGEMTGGESLGSVRGWVEAPVKTLDTGNGRRDRDLNKSMESDEYPTMRFELDGVAVEGTAGDSAAVRLRGKLTLHGVAREVVLPGRLWKVGRALRLRSDFPIDLGDYEIGGLSKMLGMLRMQEGIEVHVNLTFAP
jgi:polyisoprenoid-binding protein YceI